MPIDAKTSRASFDRLRRELTRLAKKPEPQSVHKFRTYSRRVEALLIEVAIDHHRNDEKLLKLLAKLRQKAGRLRDVDVQLGALRDLKFPQANGHKTQLMAALVEERRKREKKLANAFDRDTILELRKRLTRSVKGMKVGKMADPLAITLRTLSDLARSNGPITEETLHRYRIIGKRARYVAELASEDPEAKKLVEQLKQLQDVIGDWHDWLKLTQKAERLLGSVRDSALVAMLRNVTQAKFRQSLDAVAEVRAALAAKTSRSRRSQGSEKQATSAAAA